jgi:hypothetical protein
VRLAIAAEFLLRARILRMARAALGWGVRELAKKPASLPIPSSHRKQRRCEAIDNGQAAVHLRRRASSFTNGDQPGVRLSKTTAVRSAEPASTARLTLAAKAVRGKTGKEAQEKR